MTNKEKGLKKVMELVARFEEQLPAYTKSNYNETQVRIDFIDPFFQALGWDIDNTRGLAESYREVIHEDRVKVGGATKAPDYSFKLSGGQRLFFVEAKKPSILIKNAMQPAYQVRRYGWNAKLNVSLITDFEEFAVYDCTKKPNPTDQTSVARLEYLTFREYEKKWDFLWNTFSKEAVINGSFDKFVATTATKKGTTTVDKEFLISLDQWRTLLAETISKDNKQLNEDELNFVVQQTLDRIIFLRICEDRGIEPYGSLQEALKSGDYYKNLLQEFKQADQKYNSGLFDFKKDTTSRQVSINNKTLYTIIDQLYYPECPYEFSVLSVEILGSAYEQFLGKTITINTRGKAVIELKPEVRKAGGVYYTPQYIVDYIVANTVGKLTVGLTPTQVSELKIVDPACGSGSFLLGAYQYLLYWHKDYYAQNNTKNTLTPEGNLTTTEKKRILLNNIYGVDIDTNAVEVTKLSLLLKCMEGETQASIAQQMTIFKERVLPTLDENIKSGNSLIDTDYYDNQLDFGEERKIKPFNWQKAFPAVFNRNVQIDNSLPFKEQYDKVKNLDATTKEFISSIVREPVAQYGTKNNGGFDVVIGNPPYVDYRLIGENQVRYLNQKYQSTQTKEKWSLYLPFVELGTKILRPNGMYGNIIPNTFLSADFGKPTRNLLLNKTSINEIVDVSVLKVFGSVGTYPILLFYTNAFTITNEIKISNPKSSAEIENLRFEKIKQSDIVSKNQNYIISTAYNSNNFNLIQKIEKQGEILKNIATKFSWGTSIVGFKSYKISENDYKKLSEKDKLMYRKVLQTADIKNYGIQWKKEYIDKSIYSENVKECFEQDKIVIARLTKRIQATLDTQKYYLGKSSQIITDKIDAKYLLALLNSNILNYFFSIKFTNTHLAGGYLRFDIPYLQQLPIRIIDTKKSNEKQIQNQIISCVEQLLTLNKDLRTANLDTQKQQIKMRIDYNEDKINALVY